MIKINTVSIQDIYNQESCDINKCCNNKQNSTNGFVFKLITE